MKIKKNKNWTRRWSFFAGRYIKKYRLMNILNRDWVGDYCLDCTGIIDSDKDSGHCGRMIDQLTKHDDWWALMDKDNTFFICPFGC